jgi:DNA-binding transcriptional LysR family regulator
MHMHTLKISCEVSFDGPGPVFSFRPATKGVGIALVPASLRNLARTGVSYLDLDGAVPVLETGIVWRSGDTTPTIQRFVSIARDMISGTP